MPKPHVSSCKISSIFILSFGRISHTLVVLRDLIGILFYFYFEKDKIMIKINKIYYKINKENI